MSLMVEIVPDNDYLLVVVAGDFTLADANDVVVRVFNTLAGHALKKVLVDVRQVKGTPTTAERYYHGMFLAKEMNRTAAIGVSRDTQFAYVGTEPLIA